MDVKYNIYIATTANGPWSLVNQTPIADVPSLNTYTISGLSEGAIYYLKIIGGYVLGEQFVPLSRQPISNRNDGAVSIADPAIPAIKVLHKTPGL